MTDIGVVIGDILRLIGDRLGDLLATVADINAVEAREGVETGLAGRVGDVDPFRSTDDACRRFAASSLTS